MAKLCVTNFDSMPLTLLTQPTICALCKMMDPKKLNKNDYRQLRDLLEITVDEEKKLRRDVQSSSYKSMTLVLLRKWATVQNVTVDTLFKLLNKIERPDVIREILPYAEEDLQKAKEESAEGTLRINDNDGEYWDGILMPTVDETLFSSDLFNPGRTFDGLISYNPRCHRDRSQMQAVRKDLCNIQVVQKGGGKRYLDIVVGADELIPGTNLSTSLIRAIRYRCKRVILLISKSFAKSEECVFQMQIARGLDLASRMRKVIPVLIEQGAELPEEIFNLCAIDLTNPNRWKSEMQRLAASLVA